MQTSRSSSSFEADVAARGVASLPRIREESATTDGVRWLQLLLVVAVVIHVAMFLSLFFGYLNPLFDNSDQQLQGIDFFSIYQGGTRALHGESIFSWSIAGSVPYGAPYRYLPVFAYSGGLAFNALPPWTGYWLWVDLIEIMLVANAWLAFRITPDRCWRWVAAALWFVFTPLYLEEYMGQWSFLMATLMLWTAVGLTGARNTLSGVSWGASVLLKSNSALLGPIFLRLRQWRVLLGVGIALVVLNAPYFAFFPGDARWFWDINVGGVMSGPSNRLALLVSGDLGALSLLRTTWLSINPDAARMPPMIEPAFVLGVVGLSFAATMLPRRADVIALFGVWSCSFFLVYFSWEHHYVMLLPALVLLVALRPQYRAVALFAFLFVALPTPYGLIQHYFGGTRPEDIRFGYSPQWHWPAWAAIIDHTTKPVPVAVLWGVLVFSLLRESWRERWRAPASSEVTPASDG